MRQPSGESSATKTAVDQQPRSSEAKPSSTWPRRSRRSPISCGHSATTRHRQDWPTPRGAFAAAYEELLTPRSFIPTTFANDEGYDSSHRDRHLVHLIVRASPPPIPRCRSSRISAGRPHPRAVKVGPRRGAFRAAAPGAGAPHRPDRRLAQREPGPEGNRGGARRRTLVHDHARGHGLRQPYCHLVAPWPDPRRPPLPSRVPGPCSTPPLGHDGCVCGTDPRRGPISSGHRRRRPRRVAARKIERGENRRRTAPLDHLGAPEVGMSGSCLAAPAWPSSWSPPCGNDTASVSSRRTPSLAGCSSTTIRPSAVRRWASSYAKRCHRSSPGLRHRGRRRSQDPLSCRHGRHRRGTGRNRWHCWGAAGSSSRCRRPFDDRVSYASGPRCRRCSSSPGEHGDKRSDPRTFSKDRPIPYLRCWGDADPNSIAPPCYRFWDNCCT